MRFTYLALRLREAEAVKGREVASPTSHEVYRRAPAYVVHKAACHGRVHPDHLVVPVYQGAQF